MKSSLGISFGYHDSAVAVLNQSGELFAEQEERFSRVKSDASFPANGLDWLSELSLLQNVDHIVFYENPNIKRVRILKQLLRNPISDPMLAEEVISRLLLTSQRNFSTFILEEMRKRDLKKDLKVNFIEHHLSHAASTFFTSKFEESAILVVDGVGEQVCTSIWSGRRNELIPMENVRFPNSIGLFYAAFSAFCGFKVNSGEYKFMGLAPYGTPRFKNTIKERYLKSSSEGHYKVEHKRLGISRFEGFNFQELEGFFGMPKRTENMKLTSFHADIAASVQVILNELMVDLALRARATTGLKNICLAGGVALNCVANGRIVEIFGEERVHLFSASGDAGGAVGAAAVGFVKENDSKINTKPFRIELKESKLGKKYSQQECENLLIAYGIKYLKLSRKATAQFLAAQIANGACLGIFDGQSEFGPRALGSRSIVANPLMPKGQIHINQRIKFRESFRPFAPVVMSEYANQFFEMSGTSPYMMRTVPVRGFKRIFDYTMNNKTETSERPELVEISIDEELNRIYSPLPSVTHLDGSARVQTIGSDSNSFLRTLLEEFFYVTNCPVLVNTSFNVRGEPIIGKPKDALNCLASTGLDFLYLEGLIIDKHSLNPEFISQSTSRIQED